MKKITVSVIIPVYNGANFINAAIESVLMQTYQDFEIIVIDDGSVDSTKKEVFKFIDQGAPVKYFFQKNAGQASARNLGIHHSLGQFIAFLDADDTWRPRKLEMQLPLFNLDPQIGLVYCNAIRKSAVENDDCLYSKIIAMHRGRVFNFLLQGNFIVASSVILKKAVFDRAGMFNEASWLRSAEDYDLWLRIAQFYHFDYSEIPLVDYNYNQKIISSTLLRASYRRHFYIYSCLFKRNDFKRNLIIIKRLLRFVLLFIFADYKKYFSKLN